MAVLDGRVSDSEIKLLEGNFTTGSAVSSIETVSQGDYDHKSTGCG